MQKHAPTASQRVFVSDLCLSLGKNFSEEAKKCRTAAEMSERISELQSEKRKRAEMRGSNPSDAQLNFLRILGAKPEEMENLTFAAASALIDKRKRERDEAPPTPKQLALLKELNYDGRTPVNKAAAMSVITNMKRMRYTRWLLQKAAALGLSEADVKLLKAYAGVAKV